VYAVSLLELEQDRGSAGSAEYEVQVLRVGALAIVGFSGEPFVELGLRVKLESPTFPTYTVHMCNGCAGYVPTRQALEPEALELIGDAAVGLLRQTHRPDHRSPAQLAPR
jgi:neutral ceramidase